ncbi:MAG: FkbM family methyltransferase [Saprospiraceae bacterium]|nr:FkbM family methyltransferase [Saprospiraceae bacterium]
MKLLKQSLHNGLLIVGKILKKISDIVMKNQYRYEVFKESCFAKGYLINECGKSLKIKIDNERVVTLRTDSSDTEVFAQVFLSGEYLPAVKFLKYNGIDVKHIIDCGANIGISSVYFNCEFPTAVIYAVEPEPSNYYCLEQNLTSLSRFKKINKAIWYEKTF